MSTLATVKRTISSIDDTKVVLGGKQCGRQMVIGNSWTKIRIGVRWSVNANGSTASIATATPVIYFGICSGTTNMTGSASTDNFVGYATMAGNLVYNAGPPAFYAQDTFRWSGIKRRGTTNTFIDIAPQLFRISADPTVRSVYTIEIQKGSPNYTLNEFAPNNTTAVQTDISRQTFLNVMEAGIARSQITNYSYGGNSAGAMDESTGNLNVINVFWSPTTQLLEISDIGYFVLLP